MQQTYFVDRIRVFGGANGTPARFAASALSANVG
jgi:hypothetical protein